MNEPFRLEISHVSSDLSSLEYSAHFRDFGYLDVEQLVKRLTRLEILTLNKFPLHDPIARVAVQDEVFVFRCSNGRLLFFRPDDANTGTTHILAEKVPAYIAESSRSINELVFDAVLNPPKKDARKRRSDKPDVKVVVLAVLCFILMLTTTRMVLFLQKEPSLIPEPRVEAIRDMGMLRSKIREFAGSYITGLRSDELAVLVHEDGFLEIFELYDARDGGPFHWSPWVRGRIDLVRFEGDLAFLIEERVVVGLLGPGRISVFGERLTVYKGSENRLREEHPSDKVM